MYKLELDQDKNFECSLKVQGTSIKKSKVNLVIESDDIDFKFKGTINENGKVTIPIKKLKNILSENSTGNLYLEVIADDTYFVPFKSEYVTEVSKKITLDESVTLTENTNPSKSKPSITMYDPSHHAFYLVKKMLKEKVSIFNSKDKQKVSFIIKEYIKNNNINSVEESNVIINEMLNILSKLI